MRIAKFLFPLICSVTVLTGCGSLAHMQLAGDDVLERYQTISKDESIVVFYRPKAITGMALTPALFEVSPKKEIHLVAFIPNGSCYVHRTTPGKHEYFWTTPALFGPIYTPLLKADLKASEYYYVRVFDKEVFTPIVDLVDEDFLEEFSDCTLASNVEASYKWANLHQDSIKNRYEDSVSHTNKVVDTLRVGNDKIEFKIKPEYGSKYPVLKETL